MTTAAIETVPAEFKRNGRKQPLILQPDGKELAYTRCTTYVDCIEDRYGLQRWQLRQAAQGFGDRPDLGLSAKEAGGERSALDRIVDEALEAAGTDDAANFGSACHKLTEWIDQGLGMPGQDRIKSVLAFKLERMPTADEVAAATVNLEAYIAATVDLKALHIEAPCVLDTLKIAGTPDRVVTYAGERYIADLKTGRIDYGTGKIAAQLAVYARSHLYDIATGERTVHGASTARGIVIHLRDGVCELHWIDLEAGWDYVKDAERVRARRRSATFKSLTSPFGPPPRPSLRLEKAKVTPAARRAGKLTRNAEAAIALAKTADAVREVWVDNQDIWTEDLSNAAKARIAALEGATQTSQSEDPSAEAKAEAQAKEEAPW